MNELGKEIGHYRSRLDLWWSGLRRAERERQARNQAASSRRAEAERERLRRLAAGEVAQPQGWHQHPNDPPGYLRWWDGTSWTDHTQQSMQVARVEVKKRSSGLVVAGWLTFALGLLFWPIFVAPFVIGIILAARGVAGHGAALIALSVLGPFVSILVIAAYLSGS